MLRKAFSLVLYVVLGLTTSASSQSQPTFSHQQYAALAGEMQVQADFNGDGALDLVFAGPKTGDFNLMFSNGDGSYRTPTGTMSTINHELLGPMVVGDFNNDGRPDLAIAINGPSVTPGVEIFLFNSDGSPRTPVKYTGEISIDYMVTGDFNGDGKLDLMMVQNKQGPVPNDVVLSQRIGNGDGTFGAPVTVVTDLPGVLESP